MSDARPEGRHADHAAQFVPFAALTGYYDLILAAAEAARGPWSRQRGRRIRR